MKGYYCTNDGRIIYIGWDDTVPIMKNTVPRIRILYQ